MISVIDLSIFRYCSSTFPYQTTSTYNSTWQMLIHIQISFHPLISQKQENQRRLIYFNPQNLFSPKRMQSSNKIKIKTKASEIYSTSLNIYKPWFVSQASNFHPIWIYACMWHCFHENWINGSFFFSHSTSIE